MDEELQHVFTDVDISETFLDSDFVPHRTVSFKCDMLRLVDAGSRKPSDHFFAKFGKKVWDMLQTKSTKG